MHYWLHLECNLLIAYQKKKNWREIQMKMKHFFMANKLFLSHTNNQQKWFLCHVIS
jgi:hypothetical protein